MNCTYCGSSRNIQQDHIRAKSKGGITTVPACASCNQSKGSKTVLMWLRLVKSNNTYKWNRIANQHFRKKGTISAQVRKVKNEN